MNSNPKIIVIVGPTAVGKSDVAFELAQKTGAEIVSCDSMQVYREVAIAGNQPSQEQLLSVPHHLIGCLSVTDSFDANLYRHMAAPVIEDILKRGRIPIVVGGSGLYASALLDGIFEGEGPNLPLREQLLDEAREHGPDFLYRRLEEMDPAAAQRIHPNNVKRVIRALEVCLTSQSPISELQKNRRGLWNQYSIRMFGLSMERQALYERINQRVLKMIDQGLIDEIKSLDGIGLSQTARYLIGVREIQSHLAGELSLDEAIEKIQLNTRHLAKRQMTWFKKDERIEWVEVKPNIGVNAVVEIILGKLS